MWAIPYFQDTKICWLFPFMKNIWRSMEKKHKNPPPNFFPRVPIMYATDSYSARCKYHLTIEKLRIYAFSPWFWRFSCQTTNSEGLKAAPQDYYMRKVVNQRFSDSYSFSPWACERFNYTKRWLLWHLMSYWFRIKFESFTWITPSFPFLSLANTPFRK